MNNYKPNSHTYKEGRRKSNEERKKVEKVVKGRVKTKKKNGVSKFTDVFISEDASNVKSYVVMDVLVPAIKKAISDIVTDGIDMILYGETGRTKKRSSSSGSYVSYRSYSDRDRRDDRYSDSRTRFDYDEIIFETRGDAEAVLDNMEAVIDKYGFVTVLDMFDMADRSAPYTSKNYGWTSLRNAEVTRVRDGYQIKLPRPRPID